MDQTFKRDDYLSWDEYFMSICYLSAQRSKDPHTQVGSCIVDKKNRIVSTGYNGFPASCNDDIFPWGNKDKEPINMKYAYVCHAELNAVINKNSLDLTGCCLYSTLFPCNDCTKIIIQSGITKIVYSTDPYHDEWQWVASRRMLDAANVSYVKYSPSGKKIQIDI